MQGLLLHGIVTSASVQERDSGIMLLSTLFGMFPFLEKLFADTAYEGPHFHTALALTLPTLKTEIVKRSDQAKGFVVLPKRWIIEAFNRLAESLSQIGQGIGKFSISAPSSSCAPPPSASCCESSVILNQLSGQTLTVFIQSLAAAMPSIER
jgi:transposase